MYLTKCIKFSSCKFATIVKLKHFNFLIDLIFHKCIIGLEFDKDVLLMVNEINNVKFEIITNKDSKVLASP